MPQSPDLTEFSCIWSSFSICLRIFFRHFAQKKIPHFRAVFFVTFHKFKNSNLWQSMNFAYGREIPFQTLATSRPFHYNLRQEKRRTNPYRRGGIASGQVFGRGNRIVNLKYGILLLKLQLPFFWISYTCLFLFHPFRAKSSLLIIQNNRYFMP